MWHNEGTERSVKQRHGHGAMMMMNVQQQQPQQRQMVMVVEGTAALGAAWHVLLPDYIEKIVRTFCGFNSIGQKLTGTTGEMALVVFNTHGSQNGCLVQQSGWTSSMETFLGWLSSMTFLGGGFGDAAIAEGLAEALLLCCPGSITSQVTQGREVQKHCVLVAASNPHPIPCPVPSLPVTNFLQPQGSNGDLQAEQWWLADADQVAQTFSSCSVSLSVVAPRQLPQLRSIFSQAKGSGRPAQPAIEPPKSYAQHLVLLSEGFSEGRLALHRAAGPNNIAPVGMPTKIEHQPAAVAGTAVSGQMASAVGRPSSGIGSLSGRPASNLSGQAVAVKTEAVTTGPLSSLLHSNANSGLSLPMQQQLNPSGPVTNQDTLPSFTSLTTPEAAQDFKVLGTNPAAQPIRSVGASALTNNNMLVHSPSQSRHASSPSLPPTSPLSGLQPAPGVAGPTIVPSVTGGSGLTGQSGVTVGLGVGQGVGVGTVHNGYNNSGTPPLGANAMMGSTQHTSVVGTGLGAVNGLGSQGGLGSSNQMIQGGLGHPKQSIMGGLGGSSGTGSLIPTSNISQSQGQSQAHAINNPAHSLHAGTPAGPPAQQQSANHSMKYTKLWEGILAGQRKGNATPIPICTLEGYRQMTSSDALAADWPQTMQIMRLIPQEFMNQKDYHRKAELLVFRPLSHHEFLIQLAEKKLCAVIQLPSQTLLLASTEKPGRMIGMLFPGDMVQIKPQVSNQQQASVASVPPAGMTPSSFTQNQLQNQLPNNQLSNQVPGQQSRPQLLPGSAIVHSSNGFLP